MESQQYTCKPSTQNPSYFCIYKPDGKLWRVCHRDNIDERMAQLNKETK